MDHAVHTVEHVNPFSAIFVPDALAEAVSDRAWVKAMLAAERALALAQVETGSISADAAAAVAAACGEDYDVGALSEAGRVSGTPVTPLVEAIRARVPAEHVAAVHRGATSQDIVDTAAMLVARDAVALILVDVDRVAGCVRPARRRASRHRHGCTDASPASGADDLRGEVGGLARRHPGRTSLPRPLGAVRAARWRGGDARGVRRARNGRAASVCAVELELGEPDMPWHAIRTPLAELAGVLATTAGVAAKIGGDIVLLAQTEVGEVSEGAPGGSSTMPHKANPVSAVVAVACERHARANCAILFESLVVEHERPVGAWHAEWHALTTALAATGGAVAAVARSLDGLKVDTARMRANISTGDALRSGALRARSGDAG